MLAGVGPDGIAVVHIHVRSDRGQNVVDEGRGVGGVGFRHHDGAHLIGVRIVPTHKRPLGIGTHSGDHRVGTHEKAATADAGPVDGGNRDLDPGGGLIGSHVHRTRDDPCISIGICSAAYVAIVATVNAGRGRRESEITVSRVDEARVLRDIACAGGEWCRARVAED
jgi:hypothetical protein